MQHVKPRTGSAFSKTPVKRAWSKYFTSNGIEVSKLSLPQRPNSSHKVPSSSAQNTRPSSVPSQKRSTSNLYSPGQNEDSEEFPFVHRSLTQQKKTLILSPSQLRVQKRIAQRQAQSENVSSSSWKTMQQLTNSLSSSHFQSSSAATSLPTSSRPSSRPLSSPSSRSLSSSLSSRPPSSHPPSRPPSSHPSSLSSSSELASTSTHSLNPNPIKPLLSAVPSFEKLSIIEPCIQTPAEQSANSNSFVKPSTQHTLKELSFLAKACQRASDLRGESLSHYRTALICDHYKQHTQSIKHYTDFLHLSVQMEDIVQVIVAYNRLGLSYYQMGDLAQAVEKHSSHLSVCSDAANKYIANCNLGICNRQLGKTEAAGACFRQALAYAVHIKDKVAQQLAIDYLTDLSLQISEFSVAKLYLNKKLKLVEEEQNIQGLFSVHHKLGEVMYAWHRSNKGNQDYTESVNGETAQNLEEKAREELTKAVDISAKKLRSRGAQKPLLLLGELSAEKGDYESAVDYYQKSLQIASTFGDEECYQAAKCGLGVAEGNLRIQKMFEKSPTVTDFFTSHTA